MKTTQNAAQQGAKYSSHAKLNTVLSNIAAQLLEMHNTEAESLAGIRRYMAEFRREPDYNLVQYGNLLIYYGDIREMYENAGYKSVKTWSDSRVWETYRRQVGYIARELTK